MHIICLCVHSFLICWFPLGVFGTHFVLLGATLGLLLGCFGTPRLPRGCSLASLWLPFGSLNTPWGHLGHLGLPRGALDDFGFKMDVQFRANGFQVTRQVARLRTKNDLAEFSAASPGSPGSEGSARSGKSRSSQPHFTRAGGLDDVSLDKLFQINTN